jgi:hypothetical protein
MEPILNFNILKQFRKILRSEEMIKSKIMSYITQDFQSKSDLIVGGEEWQKVVLDMQSKFANAGAIRKHSWIANYSLEKQNKSLIKLKYHKSYFQIEELYYMMFISDWDTRTKLLKQMSNFNS